MEAPILIGGRGISIPETIGVADASPSSPPNNAAPVMKRADTAMYARSAAESSAWPPKERLTTSFKRVVRWRLAGRV